MSLKTKTPAKKKQVFQTAAANQLSLFLVENIQET